jgi:tetratricopeptide (TPR) repeat protein
VAACLFLVGRAYHGLGAERHALRYLREAVLMLKWGDDQDRLAESLYLVGNIQEARGNYPDAVKYYEEWLSIGLQAWGNFLDRKIKVEQFLEEHLPESRTDISLEREPVREFDISCDPT